MSKQSEFAVILKMNPHSDLHADDLQRVAALCHTLKIDVGEFLFQKGDDGDALYGVAAAKSASRPAPRTAAG